MLEESGALTDQSTLVVVDIGSSGSTISIVDRQMRSTVVTARSMRVSGDHFDELVYSDQTVRRRIATPADPGGDAELQARCRLAKEQLSSRSAVCLPGPGGLLLLSREVFDSLVVTSVEAFAREIREVIATSGRNPDAILLIGGGARIPIVRATLAAWLECPLIAPEQPELVTAQGAALIAESSMTPSARAVSAPVQVPAVSADLCAVSDPHPGGGTRSGSGVQPRRGRNARGIGAAECLVRSHFRHEVRSARTGAEPLRGGTASAATEPTRATIRSGRRSRGRRQRPGHGRIQHRT